MDEKEMPITEKCSNCCSYKKKTKRNKNNIRHYIHSRDTCMYCANSLLIIIYFAKIMESPSSRLFQVEIEMLETFLQVN